MSADSGAHAGWRWLSPGQGESVLAYDVERSWPDHFLEHQTLVSDQAGTYRARDLPVWTVHCPEECIGNSTIIEDDSVALHGHT